MLRELISGAVFTVAWLLLVAGVLAERARRRR